MTAVEWWESGASIWTTFEAKSEKGDFDGAHLFKVSGGKLTYFCAFDDTQQAAGLLD